MRGVRTLRIDQSLGETDHDRAPTARRDHTFEGVAGVRDEAAAQEEILRRVSGDGELGEGDDIALLRLGLGDAREDPLDVAIEITDDGIDLGESDSDHGHGRTL